MKEPSVQRCWITLPIRHTWFIFVEGFPTRLQHALQDFRDAGQAMIDLGIATGTTGAPSKANDPWLKDVENPV